MCMKWHFSHGQCGWHVQKLGMGVDQQWAPVGPIKGEQYGRFMDLRVSHGSRPMSPTCTDATPVPPFCQDAFVKGPRPTFDLDNAHQLGAVPS
jgi:hypothetical protein